MSKIVQLSKEDFKNFLKSDHFLYEPYCAIVDRHDVSQHSESHNFAMKVIVPSGTGILCHMHNEGNVVNRSTELHLYYYEGKQPLVDRLNELVFPKPIEVVIDGESFDMYVALFEAQDFGLGRHERLWPKIKQYGAFGGKAHDGTVHFPGLGGG